MEGSMASQGSDPRAPNLNLVSPETGLSSSKRWCVGLTVAGVASIVVAATALGLPHYLRIRLHGKNVHLPHVGEDPAEVLLVAGLCLLLYALSAFAWVCTSAAVARATWGSGMSGRELSINRAASYASLQRLATALNTDLKNGLSDAEAKSRMVAAGPPPLVATFAHALRDQVWHWQTTMLFALWVVQAAAPNFPLTPPTCLVAAAIVLGTMRRWRMNWCSWRVMLGHGREDRGPATVVRQRVATQVPEYTLVPGDVVVVKAGQELGVDVRLTLVCAPLEVDDSALDPYRTACAASPPRLPRRNSSSVSTGASVSVAAAVTGDPSRTTSMVLAGSLIRRGEGKGVVVAVPPHTEMCRLMWLAGTSEGLFEGRRHVRVDSAGTRSFMHQHKGLMMDRTLDILTKVLVGVSIVLGGAFGGAVLGLGRPVILSLVTALAYAWTLAPRDLADAGREAIAVATFEFEKYGLSFTIPSKPASTAGTSESVVNGLGEEGEGGDEGDHRGGGEGGWSGGQGSGGGGGGGEDGGGAYDDVENPTDAVATTTHTRTSSTHAHTHTSPSASLPPTPVAGDRGVGARALADIEALAAVDTMVLDRTGTLTEGTPEFVMALTGAQQLVEVDSGGGHGGMSSSHSSLLPLLEAWALTSTLAAPALGGDSQPQSRDPISTGGSDLSPYDRAVMRALKSTRASRSLSRELGEVLRSKSPVAWATAPGVVEVRSYTNTGRAQGEDPSSSSSGCTYFRASAELLLSKCDTVLLSRPSSPFQTAGETVGSEAHTHTSSFTHTHTYTHTPVCGVGVVESVSSIPPGYFAPMTPERAVGLKASMQKLAQQGYSLMALAYKDGEVLTSYGASASDPASPRLPPAPYSFLSSLSQSASGSRSTSGLHTAHTHTHATYLDGVNAYAPLQASEEMVGAGTVFLGVLVFKDAIKATAAEAIDLLTTVAGLRVVLVTSDTCDVATGVAASVGLIRPTSKLAHTQVICARERRGALPEALKRRNGVRVVCRATGADRVRVVEALQQTGHCVAVVGNGDDDAYALKTQGAVGITFGSRHIITDVARAAASISITEDDPKSLCYAVLEARRCVDNARKSVTHELACRLGLAITFAVWVARSSLGLEFALLPLGPVQVVTVELIRYVGSALTFPSETLDLKDYMTSPSTPRRLLDLHSVCRILLGGASLCFSSLLSVRLLKAESSLPSPAIAEQTIVAWSFIASTSLLAYHTRTFHQPVTTTKPLANPYAILWVVASAVLPGVGQLLPKAFRTSLNLGPVKASEWAVILAISFVCTVWMEVVKLMGLWALRGDKEAEGGGSGRGRGWAWVKAWQGGLHGRNTRTRTHAHERDGFDEDQEEGEGASSRRSSSSYTSRGGGEDNERVPVLGGSGSGSNSSKRNKRGLSRGSSVKGGRYGSVGSAEDMLEAGVVSHTKTHTKDGEGGRGIGSGRGGEDGDDYVDCVGGGDGGGRMGGMDGVVMGDAAESSNGSGSGTTGKKVTWAKWLHIE